MERTVQRVEERSRYEISLDGEVAGFADYHDADGSVVFAHTVVEPAHEGKGVGSQLIEEALDDVKSRGAKVVPLCSFVADFIERHERYADLVDTEALARRRG